MYKRFLLLFKENFCYVENNLQSRFIWEENFQKTIYFSGYYLDKHRTYILHHIYFFWLSVDHEVGSMLIQRDWMIRILLNNVDDQSSFHLILFSRKSKKGIFWKFDLAFPKNFTFTHSGKL